MKNQFRGRQNRFERGRHWRCCEFNNVVLIVPRFLETAYTCPRAFPSPAVSSCPHHAVCARSEPIIMIKPVTAVACVQCGSVCNVVAGVTCSRRAQPCKGPTLLTPNSVHGCAPAWRQNARSGGFMKTRILIQVLLLLYMVTQCCGTQW